LKETPGERLKKWGSIYTPLQKKGYRETYTLAKSLSL